MTNIKYVQGDATQPPGDAPRIIAHVCNDIGGWGKGFVVAISRRWPAPEKDYREWHASGAPAFELGEIQVVNVEPALWVANMIGQRGIKKSADGPPIRYPAIRECLAKLTAKATELGASVHMPRG